MRKLSALGVCALVMTISLEQPASAWINAKWGYGMNWSFQSGGNNLGCGLYRCGQPPGYGSCDPSCIVKGQGGQQCMQPQQCPPPWMWQQPYGPQGAPIFPNIGCQQNNYLDPARLACNGDGRTQSYYSPCSSWNYPAAAPGYYNSASYYNPWGGAGWYNYPVYQTSSGYYPGYQAVPYNYYANYQIPGDYHYNGWGYYVR